MSAITSKTTLAELGAIVCEALKRAGIDAFLSGGAAEGKEREFQEFRRILKKRSQ